MSAPLIENQILFRPSAKVLIRDSKFGPVQAFQVRLVDAAATCGFSIDVLDKFADGRAGRKTAELIKKISRCQSFSSKIGPDDPAYQGFISIAFWAAVAPDVAVPTAIKRAAIMSGANEGTDYTDVEFNVGTKDPGIITWGPQGATAGQAFQVQRILRKIDKQLPDMIDTAFASEASAVRNFMVTSNVTTATTLITAVVSASTRKNLWIRGFMSIGQSATVRAIYDAEMAGKNTAGVNEAIANFFRSYWSNCWLPTEVDAAFFLDRAVQITVYQSMTNAAVTNVAFAQKKLGRQFSPAERRRAIAANFQGKNMDYVGDRLARDVAFYIDGLGAKALTNETLLALRMSRTAPPTQLKDEVAKWQHRTGTSALDYGLIDARMAAVPPGLTPPECSVTK
ncbi:MAG: hypothetical protein AB1807_04240 [Pseudomonadota bacterium]